MAATFNIGDVVGGFRLESQLGEGGMGVVHLARKPGGERVALKVLRPHVVGDDEARQRLAREVSSLSRVRSRRVAEIVDADPWGDIPFVATRYVPGLSVHDHVREEGSVTEADLVWFAACLGEALLDDLVAQLDALVADVHPGPRNELLNLLLALPAEGALEQVCALTDSSHQSTLPLAG